MSLNKAQLFSVDFLVAILAFISILVLSITVWDFSTQTISSTERRTEAELSAFNVLSSLIETPGIPSNWTAFDSTGFNETNILALGLARNDTSSATYGNPWILDQAKINYLNASTYNATKKILGLSGHEFSLSISVSNGTAYALNHAVSGPVQNTSHVVRATRYALLDNQITELVLQVVKNE